MGRDPSTLRRGYTVCGIPRSPSHRTCNGERGGGGVRRAVFAYVVVLLIELGKLEDARQAFFQRRFYAIQLPALLGTARPLLRLQAQRGPGGF
eukprot:947926-Pyramimonas_sp.AAC.1